MKLVAPLHECQLRAELLRGEEHVGVGGTAPRWHPHHAEIHQAKLFPGRKVFPDSPDSSP